MVSLEDECFIFPDEDLFSALGQKTYTEEPFDNGGFPKSDPVRVISRRQHRIQRAWAQADVHFENNLVPSVSQNISPGRRRWLWAYQRIQSLEDPWKRFHLQELPEERAIRYRYSALKKAWVEDEVRVKMAPEPFTAGAMRECHRLKKLSKWVHCADWSYAANYVGKRYKESVSRDVYFEDVRLQMEAKLWGEEFNRSNPPKKVDFVQMSVLEFVDRPGQPLYHLEHFIEGDYRKYNSNSGFVDETLRCTPQAFSHFTFERSGHQLIVIDVQGVGDLYTDPQIHTADGNEYSDGNLGTRGMALFFHSHRCNQICASLGLSKFDLTTKEGRKCTQRTPNASAMTVVRDGILPIGSPDMCCHNFFAPTSPTFPSTDSGVGNLDDEVEEYAESEDEVMEEVENRMLVDSLSELRGGGPRRPSRRRYESSCSELDHEEDHLKFHDAQRMLHQPSCRMFHGGRTSRVLANVHHELSLLHKNERFSQTIDWEAVVFHEKHAAEMGCIEAMINMGKFLQRLPSDLLQECLIEPSGNSVADGFSFMVKAAELGDRSAMIFVASSYHHGQLGSKIEPDWRLAAEWYRRAVATTGYHDDEGCYDSTTDHPIHQLLNNMAELYLYGGNKLPRDCCRAAELFEEAAEAATCAMKGRFACRMYELAEEARCAEEEEEEN